MRVKEKGYEMKVLFIPNEPSFLIMDEMIYHGLVEKFGRGGVIDYPFKPSFHGIGDRSPHSRLEFTDPDPVIYSESDILGMKDSFDLVVICSQRQKEISVIKEVTNQILSWNLKCPKVVVDGEDSAYGFPIPQEIHKDPRISLYFQRDYMEEYCTSHKIYPLHHATYGETPHRVDSNRPIDVSLSGIWESTFRKEVWDVLESMRGEGKYSIWLNNDRWGYPESEYLNRLRESNISLSTRGNSWDSHKYWRIPVYGCVLMSQRLPIVIENNFEHMKSGVFFDRPGEIPPLLECLLGDENELRRIAKAGQELTLRHHTSISRIEYILNKLRENDLL